jgi:Domain of unknown function (DUF4260)
LTNTDTGRHPAPRALLGAAGLPLLAGSIAEMAGHGGAAIWSGLLGLAGPDLAFAAGARQPHERGRLPRRAIPVYNVLHRPWLPLIMLAAVSVDGQAYVQASPYVAAALGWLAHIALDRALGFNLRAADGSIRA